MKKAACVFIAKVVNNEVFVLTATRRNKPKDYNLIGGKLDEGETPEQAAIREGKEEADITLFNLKLIYKAIDADGYECSCFMAEFLGQPRSVEPGIDIGWIKATEFLAETNTYHLYNHIVYDLWEDIVPDNISLLKE